MYRLHVLGISALGLLLAAGCENTSTTTGPATSNGTSGKPAVKRLDVTVPARQTLEQGESDKVSISITRDNFTDPVTVRLNDMPQGITCEEQEVVIPKDATSAKLTLKAAPDAAAGEFKVKVDAQAPGIDENVQTFDLTVKDKGKSS